MPKTQKNPRVSTPDLKEVFGQGAKALRVGLYARVSTHEQQTLPQSGRRLLESARRREVDLILNRENYSCKILIQSLMG